MENPIKTPREQELENLIAEKEQQIKRLEGLVNELKLQLKNNGGTSNLQELLNYYLKKYDEYYAEIAKAKGIDLNNSEVGLHREIEELQKKHLQAQETLKANEGYQQKINEIQGQISGFDAKIAEKENTRNNEVDALIQKIDEITDLYNQEYGNLINGFHDALSKRIPFEDFFSELDHYQAYLENDGYAAVRTQKEHQLAINKVHIRCKQEQDELIRQREELEKKIEELKKNLVVTDIFDIEEQIFSKTDALESLKSEKLTINDRFELLRSKHISNFNDVLYKLRLFGKAPSEMGAEFEKLLDLFVQELNMVDEEKRHEELRLKELNDLKSKAHEIEKLQQELPDKEKELSDLQKTYSDAHKEITEMETYIAKCKPLLEPSSKYYDWYLSFEALREKLKRLNAEKQNQINAMEDLYKRRKQMVYNPFAKDSLKELDGKIMEEETRLQNLKTSINDTIAVWNAVDSNPEQARLKSIIEQKNRFEDKLPQLYQGLNELKAIIDDKYNAIAEIKEKLLNLQNIYEEIGNLENENNN